jgi:hypothetical protein
MALSLKAAAAPVAVRPARGTSFVGSPRARARNTLSCAALPPSRPLSPRLILWLAARSGVARSPQSRAISRSYWRARARERRRAGERERETRLPPNSSSCSPPPLPPQPKRNHTHSRGRPPGHRPQGRCRARQVRDSASGQWGRSERRAQRARKREERAGDSSSPLPFLLPLPLAGRDPHRPWAQRRPRSRLRRPHEKAQDRDRPPPDLLLASCRLGGGVRGGSIGKEGSRGGQKKEREGKEGGGTAAARSRPLCLSSRPVLKTKDAHIRARAHTHAHTDDKTPHHPTPPPPKKPAPTTSASPPSPRASRPLPWRRCRRPWPPRPRSPRRCAT